MVTWSCRLCDIPSEPEPDIWDFIPILGDGTRIYEGFKAVDFLAAGQKFVDWWAEHENTKEHTSRLMKELAVN